jgi:hypothetical protein
LVARTETEWLIVGRQIIQQPNGQFAIFSTFNDQIILWDATQNGVVDFFVTEAAEDARASTLRLIELVTSGVQARHPFALTWEEALASDRDHDGEAWQEFTGDLPEELYRLRGGSDGPA